MAVGHDQRLIDIAGHPGHHDSLQLETRLFGLQSDDDVSFGQRVEVGKRDGRL